MKWFSLLLLGVFVGMVGLVGCGDKDPASSAPGTKDVAGKLIPSGSKAGGYRPPVANAGVDQKVSVGTIVTLNGSASSVTTGTALTYQWTAPAGITLSSTTVAKPTFTASAAGTYRFSLVIRRYRKYLRMANNA